MFGRNMDMVKNMAMDMVKNMLAIQNVIINKNIVMVRVPFPDFDSLIIPFFLQIFQVMDMDIIKIPEIFSVSMQIFPTASKFIYFQIIEKL